MRVQVAPTLSLLLAVPLLACPQKDAPPVNTPEAAPPQEEFKFENPGGMWMPSQMTEHAETLRALGVEFTPEDLTDPTAFPMGAVVSLGGCSASFVSDKGLVVTNHHCVQGALQQNATPEHNVITDGYLAKTFEDEKWAGPTARIYVTTAFTDVTKEILPGLDTIEDPIARSAELDARVKAAQTKCDDKDAASRCRVASYFEGAQFFAIEQLEIKDVRLVYAPDAGIGVFGGEVDNWQWPRHTGDYSFLRAYVGPDGKPADFDPKNVPYTPKHRLTIASEPLRPGDFAMVAGYPGRTFRLKTADEVREAVEWYYPRRIDRLNAYIEAIEGAAGDDEALKIKATQRLRGLHNGLTNAKGMRDGLSRGLAAQKAELEAGLKAWISEDDARKQRFGTVLDQMAAVTKERNVTRNQDAAITELLRGSSLFRVAKAVRGAAKARDENPEKADSKSTALRLEAMTRSYDPKLDMASLELAIARTAKLPENERPNAALEAILGKAASKAGDPAAVHAALEKLYKKTKLGDEKARLDLLSKATTKKLEKSRDPFVRISIALEGVTKASEDRAKKYRGQMAALRPVYIDALREFTNGPLAPDANSTLRISYGTVRGYKPKPDAQMHAPFTTLAQMVAKHTDAAPFDAPESILAAAKNSASSGWVDPELGDVPVNFLADLDITGGNSGSATLNARGELIGLAFDGNYESIASDWVFEPAITRSIHVDVRYILWIMEHVDGATHLLAEMGVPLRGGKAAAPAAGATSVASPDAGAKAEAPAAAPAG